MGEGKKEWGLCRGGAEPLGPGSGGSPAPGPVAGRMEELSPWCWGPGKHWVGFIGQLGGEQPPRSWSPENSLLEIPQTGLLPGHWQVDCRLVHHE